MVNQLWGWTLGYKDFSSVRVVTNFKLEDGEVLQVNAYRLMEFKIETDSSISYLKLSKAKDLVFSDLEHLTNEENE